MFFLIDTRNPPPDPIEKRPAWEPNWRLWTWVAVTTAALAGAQATSGIVSYGLVLLAFFAVCRAVSVILPPLDGLRDYRQ